MRYLGRLQDWNDDRGFGFIEPADGGQRVFVHVSAFERGYGRPAGHELVHYDLATDKRGHLRASNVSFVGRRRTPVPVKGRRDSRMGLVAALFAAGLVIYGWQLLFSNDPQPASFATPAPPPTKSSRFQCEGKRHCGEMDSCAEARFYLNNCPGVEIDGDGDGIPCESQLCGH